MHAMSVQFFGAKLQFAKLQFANGGEFDLVNNSEAGFKSHLFLEKCGRSSPHPKVCDED